MVPIKDAIMFKNVNLISLKREVTLSKNKWNIALVTNSNHLSLDI